MGISIIFSQEQIEDIKDKYKNNWTLTEIGNFYKVSSSPIKRILLENNISIRHTTPKYHADYDVFEVINTPEKAYWLGFIAADGCNYSREHNATITIRLNQKDKEHLEKFRDFCKSNAKIKEYTTSEGFSNNSKMCKIALNSKKMSQDLTDKGVVPNKSLILKPPRIEAEFYKPYILGYFDGDGSIYKTNQYNNYSISLMGTKETLDWVKEILNWETTLKKRNPNNNNNNYYIMCGGTQKPYGILKQLYDSCEIHLDRKYEIYKTLETVVLNRNIK